MQSRAWNRFFDELETYMARHEGVSGNLSERIPGSPPQPEAVLYEGGQKTSEHAGRSGDAGGREAGVPAAR